MLTYGNWLYTQEPDKQVLDRRQFPAPFPPAPRTREEFDAYKRWIQAMARHYKGSVAYWEIWNEEDLDQFQLLVNSRLDLIKSFSHRKT
jgi:GH35 family endo-1,4-beta-xylanase